MSKLTIYISIILMFALCLSQLSVAKTDNSSEKQIAQTITNNFVINMISLNGIPSQVSFVNMLTLLEIELKKALANIYKNSKDNKIAYEIQPLDQETNQIIQKYSQEFKIPAKLVSAIIIKESAGHQDIVSYAGACGLMQLMPDTFKQMTGEKTVEKIFNPELNIYSGIKYLKYLLKLYKGSYKLAIMAYNAGPFDAYGNIKWSVDQFPKVSKLYYRSIWLSYSY